MIVDLHCHSRASDGELSPVDLIALAKLQGVGLLAITDHDTIEGYLQVKERCANTPLRLIAGVELSCLWGKTLIHVVALNINPDSPELLAGLAQLQSARGERAQLIAKKLDKYGFTGSYDYVRALAGDSQIGRPHFARFLVERGHVKDSRQAFKKFLGAGKPGDIKLLWPALATVLGWVQASGGVAVLAHPLQYKMTATKLRALLSDFKAAGGGAMEVISGLQDGAQTAQLASLAQQFGLMASVGSDFHQPGMPWRELGRIAPLPKICQPVWRDWL